MSIESASYISGLVSANPPGTDVISEGDNHLRLIKTVLKATLPNGYQAMNGIHTSEGTAPTSTSAGQLWFDTSANLLKMRNEDDDGWIVLAASEGARVLDVTHAIQTASSYMRNDTSYATTGYSITHNKLSATSNLYVYLNCFITGTSNFENESAWTNNLRLAKGASPDSGSEGDLVAGTTDDLQCVYFEDVGRGPSVTYDMSAGYSRIFKVIAANCPHGTTGNNEFQVWSKITADSDDGGTTFVNGTMYVMEIEE